LDGSTLVVGGALGSGGTPAAGGSRQAVANIANARRLAQLDFTRIS
jgi:hypothetical protein